MKDLTLTCLLHRKKEKATKRFHIQIFNAHLGFIANIYIINYFVVQNGVKAENAIKEV
jgi:hypothetical protein